MEAGRVAILSDVHGNAAALDAVLSDLEGRDYDAILLGGDYALFGPRPADAMARLQALDAAAVIGNTDRALFTGTEEAVVAWTLREMTQGDLAWLDDLPFGCTVRAPGEAARLLFVHATPRDLVGLLITEENERVPWPVTPADEAEALVGDASADLIAYGHIHYASAGTVAGQRVASVGSVGFPTDGDPRAAYAIASVDNGHWRLEHHRVAYDHESVAKELRAANGPYAENLATRIEQACYITFE